MLDTAKAWNRVGLYAMVFVCFVFPFVVGTWGFSENVIFWRIFNSSNSAHHMTIIWTMGLFFIGARYISKSNLVALFTLLMVVAVHELFWWFTDWFFVGNTVIQGIYATPPAYLAGLLSGYLFPLSIIVCIYWVAFRFAFPWKFIVWMGAFYLFWAFIGFPVSVNFSGPTVNYLSLWTNGLEWGSWAWGLAGFLIFERPTMRGQSLLIKALSS